MTVGIGSVTQNTNRSEAQATQRIQNGQTDLKTEANKQPAVTYVPSFFPNPMEQFASYNVLWTMAVLTPQQFNDPASYRSGGLGFAGAKFSSGGRTQESSIIFSSAGRGDQFRTKTFYGSPEYFVDNFTMKAIVAANEKTGNTNAFKFEFEIYEPYSMGLLLQSMQVAATKAGYVNYLDNAPYVLKMDMVGWDELGKKSVSVSSKYFVMKLASVKFKVTETGSQYSVEAIPYNHQAFSDAINTTYSDLKIKADSAGTVEEILSTGSNSLMKVLNDIEEKALTEKLVGVKDEYVIQFPQSSSEFVSNSPIPGVNKATINPNFPASNGVVRGTGVPTQSSFTSNDISKSSLGFNSGSGGNIPFAKHGDIVDEKSGIVKRDNMTVDPKNRAFQFAQNQKITAMINQIILSSDYAKKALDSKNLVNGFVKWWRIDVQIELLSYDPIVGDFAKRIIYRVVPFLVHHTVFSDPSTAPLAYPEIQKRIVKQYNYIYTGQNVDILKFDIDINTLFFTGVNPSRESQSAQVVNPEQKGPAEPTVSSVEGGKASTPAAQAANLGRPRPKKNPNLLSPPVGGSGDKTTEQRIAESFHQAFVSGASADMVKVNLEILGDPYWIVDSGIGNYFASKSSETSQITNDGTMNYESGDVFIYLSFRTPVDINEKTGTYDFSKAGKDSVFSGIYRVVQCESNFNSGVWKQRLECIRMPGQPLDYQAGGKPFQGIKPSVTQDIFPRKPGPPEPPATSPQDDDAASGYSAFV